MTDISTTLKFDNSDPKGGYVWFKVTQNANGQILGIEEHDSYQGGPITLGADPGVTLIDRMTARGAPASSIELARALIR